MHHAAPGSASGATETRAHPAALDLDPATLEVGRQRERSAVTPAPHADEPVPDRPRERHQLHRPVLRATLRDGFASWWALLFDRGQGTQPHSGRRCAHARPAGHPAAHGPRSRLRQQAIETLRRKPRARPTRTCCAWTCPAFPGIAIYFKDEAAHPTGSLKHRLARSLFLYALCNGRLRSGQTVVDASSGSTAISEAWFARLLGLPFIAVMPACTAPGKIARRGVARRQLRPGRRPGAGPRAGGMARRARRLPSGSVRPGRTGHRLARQQQYRRIDPGPDGATNPIRSRPGSSAEWAPAAPRPRSAATCVTDSWAPACAWPSRRAAPSPAAGCIVIAPRWPMPQR